MMFYLLRPTCHPILLGKVSGFKIKIFVREHNGAEMPLNCSEVDFSPRGVLGIKVKILAMCISLTQSLRGERGGSEKAKQNRVSGPGLLLLCVCSAGPTLCNPINCSPPVSSVHGIFQARILEWLTILLLRGNFLTQEWN